MPDLISPSGVHLLGPKPTAYPIAGHVLGFVETPDEVSRAHAGALHAGYQPDVGFVLLWQRTSMNLAVLMDKVVKLERRCAELEKAAGLATTETLTPADFGLHTATDDGGTNGE